MHSNNNRRSVSTVETGHNMQGGDIYVCVWVQARMVEAPRIAFGATFGNANIMDL